MSKRRETSSSKLLYVQPGYTDYRGYTAPSLQWAEFVAWKCFSGMRDARRDSTRMTAFLGTARTPTGVFSSMKVKRG